MNSVAGKSPSLEERFCEIQCWDCECVELCSSGKSWIMLGDSSSSVNVSLKVQRPVSAGKSYRRDLVEICCLFEQPLRIGAWRCFQCTCTDTARVATFTATTNRSTSSTTPPTPCTASSAQTAPTAPKFAPNTFACKRSVLLLFHKTGFYAFMESACKCFAAITPFVWRNFMSYL